jgi:RNA polymerase sigma factor (sigma-70 family)
VTLPPFQRLVDAHWRDVARLAHALAGPVDGDDVAQQAWTQALVAYPRLRSDQNLRGWLLTVTARCATDAHRSRTRRATPVAEIAPDAKTTDARATDPASPVDRLPDDGLWEAVRRLPDRQRVAVALRYVGDLDHAEIARRLDTTPAASRRLVSDALATLRLHVETREDS